jgi:hypothetical protein
VDNVGLHDIELTRVARDMVEIASFIMVSKSSVVMEEMNTLRQKCALLYHAGLAQLGQDSEDAIICSSYIWFPTSLPQEQMREWSMYKDL